MEITDLQDARRIIQVVGESHQREVINLLRSATYEPADLDYERQAQNIVGYMEREYALEVANELLISKHDEIPDYLKPSYS